MVSLELYESSRLPTQYESERAIGPGQIPVGLQKQQMSDDVPSTTTYCFLSLKHERSVEQYVNQVRYPL